ncbi:hypothetical protein SUGI_0898210 [Cryptomeria japonica]|uniref:uncharacterized protein LOC131072985 n=1 Tax=Cryptomeria japonica TaxID=3369 RepID=UPI00241478B8|nr:uncharacterized protein LOC131072985 [Cryptomeria japonica]GLJ43260.1 hypothetical protein SUGI_0898210 [Cryptomeria japonica]
MAFSSFPLSYKSLQENISSMYKNMHTFSFRKIEDETPEQRLAHQQSENLKWQQDMFHRILNKIGLHKEGIVSEEEVDATRSDLLYALIASPAEGEWPAITRDKLLFLQELFYANCISEEDYNFSKRPLLLRLAVQGAEIDSRDVLLSSDLIPCTLNNIITEPDKQQVLPESVNRQETEWSVVELKEDQSMFKNFPARRTGDCSEEKYSMKQEIIMPCLGLTPYKGAESKEKLPSIIVPKSLDFRTATVKDCCPARNPPSLPMQKDYKGMAICIKPTESFKNNPFWHVAGSLDTPVQPFNKESLNKQSVKSSLLENTMASWAGHKRGTTRAKVKKAFNQLLLKVHKDHSKESQTEASYSSHISDSDSDSETDEQQLKFGNKSWGLDLFKSSKKNKNEEDTDHLPLNVEMSEESLSPSKLILRPIGQGPNTKKIKRKIHSDGAATDFFVDKVLGENIKMELSRILAEMGTTNPNPNFTDEQIESIATQLPVDKNELKKFFPTSWCERYGDVVLDVVRKEFKHHIREMENLRRTAQERRSKAAKRWSLKDHDMNCSPKTDKTKVVVHNSFNRYFASQDENSAPNNSHQRPTTKVTFSLPSSKAQLTYI